ncbi:molybdenum cofactor guanylyltransferase MobA [Falsirhodobacter algicola]|uniref:Molybdenum cofactor guanylyltransferase n=1 Tax=Falsirhodobacter algicola TaxID=2692330 RepID=A0A8J8SK48_9RHOB|nr:molybdenum cofactor guanylyltransferase MobA [Falsirhodobacter algicola]QUS35098.1 molybdenum cofactor guanylyltransferase MobA [Falsirhodobacter algicola]
MIQPCGLVLAGGQGARMDGADKALLPLGGRTLLDHVLARLAPQVPAIAISANGDPARFARFGLPVLPDETPDRPGPLGGILAGLVHAQQTGASHVLTVAVDTPFFPADLARHLPQRADAPLLVQAGDDPHPTFGLWPVAVASDLRAALGDGLRRVRQVSALLGGGMLILPPAEPDPFFNINTPADLRQAEARLVACP